jgi:hypothetical protein
MRGGVRSTLIHRGLLARMIFQDGADGADGILCGFAFS